MNLLQNKRKREDVTFDSVDFIKDTDNIKSIQPKKFSDFINSIEKNNFETNKNNYLYNKLFQPIFNNKNFKKVENYTLSPLFNLNLNNPNSDIISKNKRLRLFFSPPSFKIEKFINLEAFLSNNYSKIPNYLYFNKYEINDINKNKIEQELKNSGDENKNNKKCNFFDLTKKQTHFSIKKEIKAIKSTAINNLDKINNLTNSVLNIPNINANLFTTKNTTVVNGKKANENLNNGSNFISSRLNDKNIPLSVGEISKPFQTYNIKLLAKNNQNSNKQKSGQPKIFHIEKIYNKKEYKDANEKESDEEDKNLKNRFKISLKKIKQIYTNSCLKIYSYLNDKINYNENNLSNELFISNITQQVYEIIKEKKINSSKMNEILQINDDDKYRKHYFMFTSEAKQFCLDLITIKKLSFDVVMKMCKVPRKSLRRWSHVGCNRKKGCGRKTRNPEMENKLVEWYNEVRNQNVNVSAKMIRDKAVQISDDKDFLASKGWLEKFKKKFNIKIVPHKNKNFKKIISLKEKIYRYKENGMKEKDNFKEINDNYNRRDEKDEESEEENNKSENEDENEINENKDNNEKEKLNTSSDFLKNCEAKNKSFKDNILKKPIFLKTKVFDKGNSKRFNVYKYSFNY